MIAIGQTGWIGIDIGTSTVKLAQLTRNKNMLRVTGLAIVPRCSGWPITDLAEQAPLSSADEMCAAVSLHPEFRGKRAAATLPMALCNVHALDRPIGQEAEDGRFIQDAIEMKTQRSAENLQFDVWDTETEADGCVTKHTNVLTVANSWTDQLVEDITQLGWSCQTIDGLPLALARAVAMADPHDASAPTAALDWGYGKATFCVVVDGRPVYLRTLKDCGLHHLLERLVENLDVTQQEAQSLLQEHGIASTANSPPTPTGELIEEILAEPLSRLESEYHRTISYLQFQRQTIVPKSLTLFGGGATINGLSAYLTRRLGTDTKIWQFGHETTRVSRALSKFQMSAGQITRQPNPASCLFGPAIALSALAWEQQ